jgi:hypothetical protein
MSKYQPLGDFLRAQRATEVPMSFAEIERVTGIKLPPKAQNSRAWWSNNPSNNVMTKVWLAAGFKSEQIDISARRLVFRRMRKSEEESSPEHAAKSSHEGSDNRHPLFGAMKGLIRIMPGTDLTKPADPHWGDAWDKEN